MYANLSFSWKARRALIILLIVRGLINSTRTIQWTILRWTPRPSRIAVVDDVLTTSAHFKAIKRILKETFDEVEVLGLFLARRVPNTE
jgi:hypothetical protein